ncbi:MAG: dihydrofolate reductase [Kamptonema sp. SIO1D9]|nr:dihydrofolate reductase [Kamptonema sp. SIO1D9]
MPKIILFITCSLDGYIARKSGELDWLSSKRDSDRDNEYTEFFNQIDTVLMGKNTYQQILDFGEYPYKGKQGFVFSRTLSGKKDENVEFVQLSEKFINDLRKKNQGDIWLIGGAKTIHYFLKHNAIDRLILAIQPIILGDGIPLIIKNSSLELKLDLKKVASYDSGLLQLTYDTNS